MKTGMSVLTGILVGATLIVAHAAQAQSPEVNKPWCGTDSDGAMNCVYTRVSECEKWMRPDGWCVPNPRAATTTR